MILDQSCLGYTPEWNDKEYCYPVVFPWEVILQDHFGLEHFQQQDFTLQVKLLNRQGGPVADITASCDVLIGKDTNGKNLFNVRPKEFPATVPDKFIIEIKILSGAATVYNRFSQVYAYINDTCLAGFKLPTPNWQKIASGGVINIDGLNYSPAFSGAGLPPGIKVVSNTDRQETFLVFDGGRYLEVFGQDSSNNVLDFEYVGMICESGNCKVDSILLEGIFDCEVPDGHYTGDVIPADLNTPTLFPYRVFSRVYADLIQQPAQLVRTIAVNNKNQRSERTRQWLLQGYMPLPSWQKEEIETLFMAGRIFCNGQEFVFKEGSIFERQEAPFTSGFWLKVILEELPEIKDYTCDDRCNSCGKPTNLNYTIAAGACPEGYTLSDDGTYCFKIDKVAAAPPSGSGGTPGIAYNRKNPAYSNFGARIYKVNGYNTDGTPKSGKDPSLVTTAPLWANPAVNNNNGRLNAVGIWGVDNCSNHNYQPIADEFIGFSRKVDIPATKTYYIGIAGDNQAQIKINGVAVVTQPYPPPNADNFKYWHIYPVTLQAGINFIELLGKDDGSVSACFGAEIYNNTEAELKAATSEADLNIVFSTKSIFCEPFDVGQTAGWSCPAGFSVDNSTDPPMCSRIIRTAPDNAPTITWSASGRALRYEVQWRQIGSADWSASVVTEDTHLALALAQNASYQVRVRSVCSDQNSDWSYLGVNTFTSATDCLQPTGIVITDDSAGNFSINWEDITGAKGYNFRYRLQGTGAWTTSKVTASETSLPGLTLGAIYEFQIQTICSDDLTSNWGNINDLVVGSAAGNTTCPIVVAEEFTGSITGIKNASQVVTLSGTVQYVANPIPAEGEMIEVATIASCCIPFNELTIPIDNEKLTGELTISSGGQVFLYIDTYKSAPGISLDLTGLTYQSVAGECPPIEDPGGGVVVPDKITAAVSIICNDAGCKQQVATQLQLNFSDPTPAPLTLNIGLIYQAQASLLAVGYDLFTLPAGVTKAAFYNQDGQGNKPFIVNIPAGMTSYKVTTPIIRNLPAHDWAWLCQSCQTPVTDLYIKVADPANYLPDFSFAATSQYPNTQIHNV